MELCRMCSIVEAAGSSRPADIASRPVWETEHFVVVPSLGALVEGHVMVVSRRHALSSAALDARSATTLGDVLTRVQEVIRSRWGSAVTFEHGPCVAGSSVGCTVDHAHVHVLPQPANLKRHFELQARALEWVEVPSILDATTWAGVDRPYLYIGFDGGSGFAATGQSIPSQFFRRLVTDACGDARSFNWRVDHRLDLVQRTADSLEGAFEVKDDSWGMTTAASLKTA